MRGNGGVKLTSRTASLLVILLDGVGRLFEEREIVRLKGIEEVLRVKRRCFYVLSVALYLVVSKCYRGYIIRCGTSSLATPGLLRAPPAAPATTPI
jgi:hypothetical protein